MRSLILTMLSSYLVAVACPAAESAGGGRYVTHAEFLDNVFPGGAPARNTLWVQGDLRQTIESYLDHPFASLRVSYWRDGEKTAWILDEIGKELPITIGVTVGDGAIHQVRILEFRESRGWEVRYPFFTDQFRHARLKTDGALDRRIDGISGATLSVGAVTRMARVALLLHEKVTQAK